MTTSLPSASSAIPDMTIRKRVASLKPSPENEEIYSTIDPDGREIIKLAERIAKNGCVPLVVTADNFIVSGHRRHAALTRNGTQTVHCHVLPVRRDEMTRSDYIALLSDHNAQRQKSVAEQVREELIDIDRDSAYQTLRQWRDESIHAHEFNTIAPPLTIQGAKRRHAISSEKAEHVSHVKTVILVDRKDFWPLSVRAVHYALLNYTFLRNVRHKLPYKNDAESYEATSNLLTRLRLNRVIPWEALDDSTRPFTEFRPFKDVRHFVRQEMRKLFGGYWRSLLQTQPHHIEVVCEKNTVYHLALSVAKRYQIPTTSARGFNCIDSWHDLYERYMASGKDHLYVIVLSDYDPEGQQILHVGGRTLRDDFGVDEDKLHIIPAGVTRAQIERYSLPTQNFAKEDSSNCEWFIECNDGNAATYELEALNPRDLIADFDKDVRSILDINLFNLEAATEHQEAAHLEAMRKTAVERLKRLDE